MFTFGRKLLFSCCGFRTSFPKIESTSETWVPTHYIQMLQYGFANIATIKRIRNELSESSVRAVYILMYPFKYNIGLSIFYIYLLDKRVKNLVVALKRFRARSKLELRSHREGVVFLIGMKPLKHMNPK